MSTSTDPLDGSATTDTDNSDETESTGKNLAYNYFFLLIAVFGFGLFFALLYVARRRKRNEARLQSHGREALARDVESWAGIGGWRSSTGEDATGHSTNFARVQSRNDSILDAGLDERGEAPPPYKTAAADKAPAMVGTEHVASGAEDPAIGIPMIDMNPRSSREVGRLPGYEESATSSEAIDMPTRPATAVTVSERLSEAPGTNNPARQHQIRASRVADRWSDTRRLMSSTQSTSAA